MISRSGLRVFKKTAVCFWTSGGGAHLRKYYAFGRIFGLPGAEHAYGSTMHLVGFFQYRELAFRRAKRAEGGFQPIKALQGCPEYAEEAWWSRNECSQCELLRSLTPYHPLWGVSLRIADVVASWWNFQCGLRHVREYLNSRFKLSTPLKAFIRAILINLTRGRAVRRARAAHEPPEVRRGVASSLRTKTCSNIVNLLCGERSEPKVDFSQSKHYRGVRSMPRKPGAKFQQDRSSRSIVMAKKPLCLFFPIYIYICVYPAVAT